MKDSPEPSTVRGEPGSVAAPPMGTHHERVPVVIFEDSEAMARQVARHAAERIRERAAAGEPFVFGLPSGSTPIGVYEELVRLHQEEGLDFSNVVAFTLEEYYPIEPDSRQSCYRFVRENLLDHLNVPEEHIYVLRGNIPPEEVEAYCHRFQRATEDAGGFDLLILGIGRSGHIGFNEPGSDPEAGARLVVIDAITRKDAASIFFGEENVPRQGITLGVGTLLNSREIMLLATGEHKGPIVRRAVEEEPNVGVTASHLQHHPNTTFYLDRAAAGDLTRERTPWLVGTVDWDPVMAKRAVIWLSKKLDKAILTLEESDFYRNNLHDLVYAYGHVDHLCREVFEDLRHRIVYMEQLVSGEPVVVFSPHPDDDVISMGGMLDKLVANGNDVLVAYMTNGSVAVFDDDVRRYLQFLEFSRDVFWQGGAVGSDVVSRRAEILDFLDRKAPGEVDTEEVQAIKANIRYAEAVSAIGVMGLDVDHARFLDMTFYKTGRVRKNPIGPADVQAVLDLLAEVRPTHVFVAGDLSDPHGTHRLCYQAIDGALRLYNERYVGREDVAGGGVGKGTGEGGAGTGEGIGGAAVHGDGGTAAPLVWLYRGAWQEWEIHAADVFLPLSKADLDRKLEAIFKHESQKDRAMFPGAYDDREFWQRARDRNTDTARALDRLGLPEFYAAEAFVTTYAL